MTDFQHDEPRTSEIHTLSGFSETDWRGACVRADRDVPRDLGRG